MFDFEAFDLRSSKTVKLLSTVSDKKIAGILKIVCAAVCTSGMIGDHKGSAE